MLVSSVTCIYEAVFPFFISLNHFEGFHHFQYQTCTWSWHVCKPQIKPRFLNLLMSPNVRPTAQCNSPGFLVQLQHFHSRARDPRNEATLVHAGMQTLVKIDTLKGQGEFSCSVISWWRKFSGRPLMEFWQHIYYVATRSVIKWSIYNPWSIIVRADGGWSACR